MLRKQYCVFLPLLRWNKIQIAISSRFWHELRHMMDTLIVCSKRTNATKMPKWKWNGNNTKKIHNKTNGAYEQAVLNHSRKNIYTESAYMRIQQYREYEFKLKPNARTIHGRNFVNIFGSLRRRMSIHVDKSYSHTLNQSTHAHQSTQCVGQWNNTVFNNNKKIHKSSENKRVTTSELARMRRAIKQKKNP